MQLKKNDEITLEITDISSMGSGVGRYENMAVFVDGALTGDKLLVHIIKVKSSYAVGIIKKIIVPSKHRIECDCEVFERCGGCSYRQLDYAHELEMKKSIVQNNLQRIGGTDVKVEEILSIKNQNHYRNKGQYPVGMTKDGKIQIGFYAKRSHRIVDCRSCLLAPKEFENIINIIAKWIVSSGATVYSEETNRGLIRHIYLRKGRFTGEAMVCLVINGTEIPEKESLILSLIQADESIESIVLNTNEKQTNVILGDSCTVIYGREYIEDTLCGVRFRISPLSFYQVNPEGAELLYTRARQYAEPDESKVILDLYCGAGTIGLTMAKQAKRIIGVEIVPQAIENAKENARLNGIENAEFICSDAGQAAEKLLNEGLLPNVIIVDPPRKGLTAEAIDASVKMSPERIVYVSCDSATLARDCKIFAQKGYEVTRATAVDMFPRTRHVETVVLLSQRRPDEHIDIKLDLSELDVTAAETKATYQEIKDYVFDKFGLKVSSLYISQVKTKCGIIERENYNKPKSENTKQPQCPKEKEDAIMDALRHFKMI